MTDQEQQLNQRLAEALDAAGLGEYAWDVAQECPQGHDGQLGDVSEYSPGQLCLACCAQQYSQFPFGWSLRQAHDDIYTHEGDPSWHPDWRFIRIPKDFSDANVLLAAVEAWIGQHPGGRTVTTEWWPDDKTWVCRITEYRYLLRSVVGIGKHPTNRTLAEAAAFLSALMKEVEK